MNKRILLGIDLSFTPATQHALRVARELLEDSSTQLHLVLVCVIPIPTVSSPTSSMYLGHLMPLAITPEQRTQAEDILHQVRLKLQQEGITSEQIEILIRVGLPADELLKVARELCVNLIIIGSRGYSWQQRLRRFLMGSISQKVLKLAPCPVLIAAVPTLPRSGDLVSWYEEAITTYLEQHTDTLLVFTPDEVAQKFIPPNKKSPGRKETAAATVALEQLAGTGLLCRHDVKGELRYVND